MARSPSDLDLLRCVFALQLDFVSLESLQAGMSSLPDRSDLDLFEHLIARGVLEGPRADLLIALAGESIRAHRGDLALSLESASRSKDHFAEICAFADLIAQGNTPMGGHEIPPDGRGGFAQELQPDESRADPDERAVDLVAHPPDSIPLDHPPKATHNLRHRQAGLHPLEREELHRARRGEAIDGESRPESAIWPTLLNLRAESDASPRKSPDEGMAAGTLGLEKKTSRPSSEGGRTGESPLNPRAANGSNRQAVEIGLGPHEPLVPLPPPPRFKILRKLSQGAWGEIDLALDVELNREVVLKEFQARLTGPHTGSTQSMPEPETLSRLQHPGIVPIYGLGTHDDGRAFYATKLISGTPLLEAIEQFHADATSDKHNSNRRLALRQLLARFVAACHAVAFAHSRGVIHGNLKPEQVILGEHGETLIVNWGQARAFQMREGELAAISPAVDIDRLGKTLFLILTGKNPDDATNLSAASAQGTTRALISPRSIEASVPRALNAICMKAMASEPDVRYAATSDLAGDLEHWLAGEPVACDPDPWHRRLARWVDRHQGAAWAAALVTTSVLGSLAVGSLLIARDRDRSRRNFNIAHLAVDRMLTRLAQSELADMPQMEPIRRDLLDDAQRLYVELSRQQPDDQSSRTQAGAALIRLGEIRRMLSEVTESERYYRAGIKILEPLAVASPKDASLKRSLAVGYHGLGVILRKLNRFAESGAMLLKALQRREALVRHQLGNPEDRFSLADTRFQLGALMARDGPRELNALPDLEAAIRGLRDQIESNPNPPEFRLDLARNLLNLGQIQARDAPTAAMRPFGEALNLLQALDRDAPGQVSFQWRLALAYSKLASTALDIGDASRARQALAPAYELCARLASEYPTVEEFRDELATLLTVRAEILRDEGRMDELEAEIRRAMNLREGLVNQGSKAVDYTIKLALVRCALAEKLQLDSKFKEAIDFLNRGVDAMTLLIQNDPALAEYRSERAKFLSRLGQIRMEQEFPGSASRSFRRAIEDRLVVLDEDAGQPRQLNALLHDLGDLAKACLENKNAPGAADCAEQIVHLKPKNAAELRRAGRIFSRCAAISALEKGISADELSSRTKRYGDRAIAILLEADRFGPRVGDEFGHSDYSALRDRLDFRQLVETPPAESTISPAAKTP